MLQDENLGLKRRSKWVPLLNRFIPKARENDDLAEKIRERIITGPISRRRYSRALLLISQPDAAMPGIRFRPGAQCRDKLVRLSSAQLRYQRGHGTDHTRPSHNGPSRVSGGKKTGIP